MFVDGISKALAKAFATADAGARGRSEQADARTQTASSDYVISTDPPYYDNVDYADLSDFFYVWIRRSLKSLFPDLLATVAVPKADELVATPYRHGTKDEAEAFFVEGMTQVLCRLSQQAHAEFPVTIYRACKRSEIGEAGTTSTGWETFLDAVIRSGFAIARTWPMQAENRSRMRGMASNAPASSIVLVCRSRAADAAATRRELLTALRSELPQALHLLQTGNVATVDLAQAAIGPGMAVYTRYAKVIDAAGTPVSAREALALINQVLDEVLAEQEGDFDADSRWAVAWFEQHGFDEGEYGLAEALSKAKNASVGAIARAGILLSRVGRVRLLRPRELPADWRPAGDAPPSAWEMVHHLVRALGIGGELATAALARKLPGRGEVARELCYRLYTLCERKRPAEAVAYNELVRSWPEIARLAARQSPEQGALFEDAGGRES